MVEGLDFIIDRVCSGAHDCLPSTKYNGMGCDNLQSIQSRGISSFLTAIGARSLFFFSDKVHLDQ